VTTAVSRAIATSCGRFCGPRHAPSAGHGGTCRGETKAVPFEQGQRQAPPHMYGKSGSNQLLSLPVPNRDLRRVIGACPPCSSSTVRPCCSSRATSSIPRRRLWNWMRSGAAACEDSPHCSTSTAWFSACYRQRRRGTMPPSRQASGCSRRAHHGAARHGHFGEWNCDDVEGARLQANFPGAPVGSRCRHPQRGLAATPAHQSRRPFCVNGIRAAARTGSPSRTAEGSSARNASRPEGQSVRPREAISRALVQHGLLLFRRRRFALALKRVVWANVP